jgi:YD repeat-containing protein
MAFTSASTDATIELVFDSTGSQLISPSSLAHTYGYDGSNNLITDTITDGVSTWVKTYTYTGSNLTSESAWVKQ